MTSKSGVLIAVTTYFLMPIDDDRKFLSGRVRPENPLFWIVSRCMEKAKMGSFVACFEHHRLSNTMIATHIRTCILQRYGK
jgi:hypothetical protein